MPKLSPSALHKIPADLGKVIVADKDAYATWEDITPLARNEWICWVTSAKKADTRAKRIRIARENLGHGNRRPCCWAGCPHR